MLENPEENFFTPQKVSELLIKLFFLKTEIDSAGIGNIGYTIYDPSCGSGSLKYRKNFRCF